VIGEIRGVGLHQVVELVKNRDTRAPLSEFNTPPSETMGKVAKSLRESGINAFMRWNMVFNTPPLTITESQLQEGLDALDRALDVIDSYYEG
jgi:taurine--2-oxoglutarate transaminase